MTTEAVKTFQVWDTVYNADCVEWCPVSPHHHIFVCGTYQLTSCDGKETDTPGLSKQVKLGYLYLLSIHHSALHHLQTLEGSAILDVKWCQQVINNKILLAVATAEGEVLVYELKNTSSSNTESSTGKKFNYELSFVSNIKLGSEKGINPLALSLDWSCVKYPEENPVAHFIVVSDSFGCVNLFKFTDCSLKLERHWKAHEYEAWITAFDYWNPSIIYSGGDDCKLLIFDSRKDEQPVVINRVHEMGVTSIHCNASKENLLVTGSYDEKLRFWDTRNMRKPVMHLPLLGGVWKLKWDPQDFEYILAACMHGGFCVVKSETTADPKIIAVYKEHESLAYGCDWSYFTTEDLKPFLLERNLPLSSKGSMIATCSFYDHKLSVSFLDMSGDNVEIE